MGEDVIKEGIPSKPIFYSDNLKRYSLIKKIAELENDYTIDDVEMCFIYHALLKSGWNRAEAARKLGICIRKMRYMIAKMKTLGFVIADNPTTKKIK